MLLSQADLVGGIVISAIGAAAVRNAQRRRGHLALAALPLLLGTHQIIEAFVWLSLEGDVPRTLGRAAMWTYLALAFVVLPVFVPLGVLFNEPMRSRKRVMVPFVGLGIIVAAYLLAALVRGPVNVELRPYHLAYTIDLSYGGLVVALYVVAICGALLLSSRRRVVTFGAVNLVAVGVIAWLTVDGFASVWCAWAAISSGAIAMHMRVGKVHRVLPLVEGLG